MREQPASNSPAFARQVNFLPPPQPTQDGATEDSFAAYSQLGPSSSADLSRSHKTPSGNILNKFTRRGFMKITFFLYFFKFNFVEKSLFSMFTFFSY